MEGIMLKLRAAVVVAVLVAVAASAPGAAATRHHTVTRLARADHPRNHALTCKEARHGIITAFHRAPPGGCHYFAPDVKYWGEIVNLRNPLITVVKVPVAFPRSVVRGGDRYLLTVTWAY
jgi:hypothetical protein